MPVVTAWVTETRINNQLLLTQFISTLSEVVSETKLVATAEALQMKAGKPLTGRDFKIMTDRIASFDGIGDAKELPRRLVVNIWPYETINHLGHASITVNNDSAANATTHMSWGAGETFGEMSGKHRIYFMGHDVEVNKNYGKDAKQALSERTREKLEKFNNLRETQKNNGSISKTLQNIIDSELKKIFSSWQQSINDHTFSTMTLEEKKIT